MKSQLSAKFKQEDGSEIPFYEKASKVDLKRQIKEVEMLVKTGKLNGFISEADSREMTPGKDNSLSAGRLYGLPKIHKGIKPNVRIPACRPTVSQSRANTEAISKFIDHHAKALIQEVPSYAEDTPDILRVFEEVDKQDTFSEDVFPVTVDVQILYTSIPFETKEGVECKHSKLP